MADHALFAGIARRCFSLAFVGLGLLVVTAACTDDDESSSDPKASCETMCKGAGFTSSKADQQPHELNCFCTGGTGTVAAAACTEMCTSVGKPGKTFRSGAGATTDNACQCQ
jgi:hypothetical protein